MGLEHTSPRRGSRWERWLTRPKLTFFFTLFFLAQATLFLGLETTSGMLDRQGQVRGRDFLQFYIAGRIVARGDVDRLYDQEHFREVQQSLVEINEKCPPYFSIYPPQVALLFSPFGGWSYENAILTWWLIQVACFWCAGSMLFQLLKPPPSWRWTAALGLAAFYPVLNTFWNGQLSGLVLLFFVTGLELHRRQRPFLAGGMLSLLAMKPQLALGIVVWLLLRRDGRTLAGLCFGGLVQVAVVCLTLSPRVLPAYAQATRFYPDLFRMQFFSPDHQHAVAGLLKNLPGGPSDEWSLLGHLLVVVYAGVLLRQVVGSRSPEQERLELSAAVLFSLLATPHLLTYDLACVLIPVTYLLSARRATGRPNIPSREAVLYLCATLAPLYVLVGFSLVPVVLVWSLHDLAAHRHDPVSAGEPIADEPARQPDGRSSGM